VLGLKQLTPLGLAPVDLTLDDGACLTISGPSGAGKSLLLRAIVDLDRNCGDAETGSVTRSQVAAPDWRKAVAYVPAESGWWADRVSAHMPKGDPGPLLDVLGLDRSCLDWGGIAVVDRRATASCFGARANGRARRLAA